MEFGKFSQLTFTDGSTPAINATNLNEIQRLLKLTDNELKRSQSVRLYEYMKYMYYKNIKDVYYTNIDTSGWTVSSAVELSLSDETTYNIFSTSALKVTKLTNTARNDYAKRNLLPKDLTKFGDGGLSDTDDIIVFSFYVSSTKTTAMYLYMATDTSNYYWYGVVPSVGWNLLYIRKSSFTVTGTPNWNNITFIMAFMSFAVNAINEYVYIQSVQMVRHDSTLTTFPVFYQKYMGSISGWKRIFEFTDTWLYSLVFDKKINKLGMMRLKSTNNHAQLHLSCDLINFISKFEFNCKYAGETPSVTWYVDDSNYIEVYITGNVFTIYAYENGVGTSTTIALVSNLLKNETIHFQFEKDINTIRAILYKSDITYPVVLEYETTISNTADGCVCLGQSGSNSFGLLTDFAISNSINQLELIKESSVLQDAIQIQLSVDCVVVEGSNTPFMLQFNTQNRVIGENLTFDPDLFGVFIASDRIKTVEVELRILTERKIGSNAIIYIYRDDTLEAQSLMPVRQSTEGSQITLTCSAIFGVSHTNVIYGALSFSSASFNENNAIGTVENSCILTVKALEYNY